MSNQTSFGKRILLASQHAFLQVILLLAAALLLSPASAFAQVTINFAGTQTTVPTTGLVAPTNVAVDSSGNLYIIDQTLTSVVKITPSGTQTTLGSGLAGPLGIAVDPSGDVFVADTGNTRVVEISAAGTQTLIGSGWTAPTCVAADIYGNVFVCDNSNVIEVPAGGGSNLTLPRDNGTATEYAGAAVDNNTGEVYLLDRGNGQILQWGGGVLVTGINYTTILSASSLSIDASGILYVTSHVTNLVQAFDESGNPTGNYGTNLSEPYGAASDGNGNIYIANFNSGTGGSIYKEALAAINLGNTNVCGASSTNPGNCSQTLTVNFNSTSLGSTGTEAHVVTEGEEGKGTEFIAENDSCTGVNLSANASCSVTLTFTPFAPGERLGAVEVASQPYVISDLRRAPRATRGKAVKPAIAFQSGNVLQSTAFVSGTGVGPLPYLEQAPIYTQTTSSLPGPFYSGIAVDVNENLYVVDSNNCEVFKETFFSSSTFGVIAGTGTCGSSADGSPGTSTQINPLRVAVNGRGDVYIDDQTDNAIRVLDANTGLISTVAGTLNSGGYSGDGGPASSAQLSAPTEVAVDAADNLYIADQNNSSIRRVDAVTGVITTVAGSYNIGLPNPGYSGDGGPATSAQLNAPTGVAVDSAGNLYISDAGNFVIRKVSASTGIISTVAGNGTEGFSGDGGPATSAQFGSNLQSVELDAGGNLYIVDQFNNTLRRVDAVTGIISQVAGNGQTTGSYTGDGGPATQAGLNQSTQAVVDEFGDIFISDAGNAVVRGINGFVALANFATIAAGVDSPAQDFTLLNEGNAPFAISAVNASANFDAKGADTTCSSTTTLNESQTCVLGVRFVPTTSGNLSGGITATDNDFTAFFPGGFVIESSGTATGVDTKLALGNVPATLAPGGNPGTVTVSVEFANNSVDSGATNAITLTITGPGGFSQTLMGTAVNGVASFNLSSLALTSTGTYTYSATAASLTAATASTTINPDTQLVLGGVPASVVVGGNPGTITVSVETANRTVDTSATNPVTLTVTGPGGFSHTFTGTAVNGVASFNLSSLALPVAGTYTYSATAASLTAATGSTTVTSVATQLVLGGVPASLAVGDDPGTVTVSVETASGSIDATASNPVTLTVTGPGGYSKTITVNAVAGLATYDLSSLVLTTPGTYTVTATSGTLTHAVATIVVAAGTSVASQLALGTVPLTLPLGGSPGSVSISIESANGTLNTSATSSITLTLTGPGGFSKTFTANAVAGVATFDLSQVTLTTPGVYTLTATSSGLSAAIASITVSATTLDFSIAANPTSSTPILPGSGAAYTITLAPTATSFPAAIAMTATGLPAGATYSFSPASVTPGSGPVTTTLSISVPKSSAAVALSVRSRAGGLSALALGALLLPLAGSRRMRRAARGMPLAALALAILSLGAVVGLSGCGAGGLFGQPQQTYPITVTGTSGALIHSTTVTLTVQ